MAWSVGVAAARFSLTGAPGELDPAHQRSRLFGMTPPEPVLSCVPRLRCLLKILNAVIRRILVDVMDDIAITHRVLRVMQVPNVLVSLNVSVLTDGRMQVPFAQRNSNEYTPLVADPRTATPVRVRFSGRGLRNLGLDLFRHATRGPVGTGPGAVDGRLVGGVRPRKSNPASWAVFCCSHASNNTGQSERGRSKSLGQRQ